MKEILIFDTIPIKFCAMVEQYRLELAKKSWIDLQLNVSLDWWTICWIHETVLISKEFWFIQWLAKHFKLNISKIDARIALSDFNATDRMLMALAISEDPITLLVDCLK